MRLSIRQLNESLNRLVPLLAGGVIVLTTCFVLSIRFQAIYLAHPNLGGVEHNVIYSILRLLNGYPLYENPALSPYSITQYGPVYYNVVAWIAKLAAVSPDDPYSVYVVSRWVSLGANGLMVVGVVQLARQLALPMPVAVGIGLLLFSWIPVHAYSRPDSFCNTLVIWTLYSLTRWTPNRTVGWYQLLTALLTALALFTKQSALCLPVIVVGYGMFVARDWRKTGVYCAALILFLALNYLAWVRVDAGVFWDNVIKGISNGTDLPNFRKNIVRYYLLPYSWLIMLALPISWNHWQRGDEPRRVLSVSAIGLFLFALATSLKQGSAFNYFAEFTALALLLVVDAGWRYRQTRPVPSVWITLALCALVAICVPFHAANFNWKLILGKPNDRRTYQQDQTVAVYLTDSLHLSRSDRVYTTFDDGSFMNTLLFRHIILPQQDIVREACYARHTYNYESFDASARSGAIRYIITRVGQRSVFFNSLNPAMYRPVKQIGNYTVYASMQPSVAQKEVPR